MRRIRTKRKPLTEKQIQERKRKNKNYDSRKRYALKQKELFLIEYSKICKRYGCFIWGNLQSIDKQERGETIYTVISHLETMRYQLDKHYPSNL